MRILIVTQYIYPENFKSNELVFELAKRGHQVEVLTGIPNYPEGVYYNGYGIFRRRIETKDGVTFYRCFQTPRGRKASGLGLALNYLSFVFSGTLWSLFYFAWKKKYDVIITHEPSPITQLIPAIILGKLRNTKVYSWIMDIWPDSVEGSVSEGVYKKIKPILTALTEWTYRNSHKILITSKGFLPLICRNNDYSKKIVYYPNWSVDMLQCKSDYKIPTLPKGFKIMVAGNLGEAQDLESVGKLILLLKEYKDLKWIFIGDGSAKPWLDDFIVRHQLEQTVYALGRFPSEAMSTFFENADAMLVTLRGGSKALDATVPARVQSYMSAAKPILAMIGEGTIDLINEAKCGYAVPSSDYETLAGIIKDKVLLHQNDFKLMGLNGRKYFEKEFVLEKCISNMENILKS